jgi:phosphoribosylaminoimidazolecarboxamide formyltransferase/IMP cyclohydrolase
MADLKKMYRTVMDDNFPEEMTITFGEQKLIYKKRTWKIEDAGEIIEKGLRYGENPGQEAALYELTGGNLSLGECKFIDSDKSLVSSLSEENLLQFGKHPGKTNLTDIDNALNIMRYLKNTPACAIMKHNNPSGVAYGKDSCEAYNKANMADALAAFGGAAIFNVPVSKECAESISKNYLEVVAAPSYEDGAVEILKGRKNLRIVEMPRIDKIREFAAERFFDFKCLIDGGIIVQQSPLNRVKDASDFFAAETTTKDGTTYKTQRMPNEKEMEDLLFGWSVEQGVTSNSVIFVKDGATVGIGTGEQDRVGVTEIAIYKAYKKFADQLSINAHGCLYFELELKAKNGEIDHSEIDKINAEVQKEKGNLIGAVAVSDAFFPKRDAVDAIIKEGVTAIVQPGGSIADKEVINVCNEAEPKIAMVFTGQRAFKH